MGARAEAWLREVNRKVWTKSPAAKSSGWVSRLVRASAILCRHSWSRVPTSQEAGSVTARATVVRAHRALLNGSDKLSYFEERGISAQTIKTAWVGYDAASGAFTYPCIARAGGLLGIHYKGER